MTSARIVRYRYGQDPSQFGDARLPAGPRRAGVLVLFHGGWWGPNYGNDHLDAVADDLTERGWVTWNVEYRRLGLGGGYPATLHDAAAAVDFLAGLPDVDTSRVTAIGHSAGGHLATWAAGRATLPSGAPGAGPRVEVSAVISLAGVLDLATAVAERLGNSAAEQFMGTGQVVSPDRYAVASPLCHVPIPAAVRCVHAPGDDRVPFTQSVTYVNAARAVGQDASLIQVEGDHFTVANPGTTAWPHVVAALEELTAD